MIHHTAISYDKNKDQFKGSNEYHKAKWRFKSNLGFYLGYNYEISANGKVRQAREDGEQTAACYQANMNDGRCLHICLDGNFDIEKPKPKQIFALRDLLKNLASKYSIDSDHVVFHSQFAKKTCPGSNIDIKFMRSLIDPEILREASSEESEGDEKKKNTAEKKEELVELLRKMMELIQQM